jgi:hypothetical protein
MPATLVTNPHHHLTTLSDAMLNCTERRLIKTPSGYDLYVPLLRVQGGKPVKVSPVRTSSLMRQINLRLNEGVPVRLPFGDNVLRFYAHSLTKATLSALKRLRDYHLRHPSEEFAHLRDFGGPSNGNWARTRWWGLTEPKPLDDQGNLVRGWWKLTGVGLQWLRGEITIPRHPVLFDGVFVGWQDVKDRIRPTDVDETFTLDSLMGRSA